MFTSQAQIMTLSIFRFLQTFQDNLIIHDGRWYWIKNYNTKVTFLSVKDNKSFVFENDNPIVVCRLWFIHLIGRVQSFRNKADKYK